MFSACRLLSVFLLVIIALVGCPSVYFTTIASAVADKSRMSHAEMLENARRPDGSCRPLVAVESPREIRRKKPFLPKTSRCRGTIPRVERSFVGRWEDR